MPNERNIEVLKKLLAGTGLGRAHESWARIMARTLAGLGVLVPASLTDEEGLEILETSTSLEHGWMAYPSELRRQLERIAKGEAV